MSSYVLVGAAALVIVSVLVSKISDRFGIPVLLLFLALGMLAGSEGPGGIYFDDAGLAQAVGVVALVVILFSGGLDTDWGQVHPVARESWTLATLGVLLTALMLGAFASWVLDEFSLLEGLLLGAIVSSTDAAAVFSVLRSKGIHLKEPLKPLLELESGSNDPMAVFLTLGLIRLITSPGTPVASLLVMFFQQMVVGAALGYLMGRLMLLLLNRIRLGYEGLYPVLSLALVFLTYGVTDALGGSGFLAVYIAGIVLGNRDFVHQRSLNHFHDGLAWLMQIAMFLTLGLLVYPSRLLPVMGSSLLIVGFLMFVARPIAVFLGLLPSRIDLRSKVFASWIGLRGAVPIILGTYPLLAGIAEPRSSVIFNIVFFIVFTSVLLQGTSIPLVARWLRVDAPPPTKREFPIEFVPVDGLKSDLREIPVASGSFADGRAIVELSLPDELLVILVARNDEFMLPSGGTVLRGGDNLLVLSDRESFDEVSLRLSAGNPGLDDLAAET